MVDATLCVAKSCLLYVYFVCCDYWKENSATHVFPFVGNLNRLPKVSVTTHFSKLLCKGGGGGGGYYLMKCYVITKCPRKSLSGT